MEEDIHHELILLEDDVDHEMLFIDSLIYIASHEDVAALVMVLLQDLLKRLHCLQEKIKAIQARFPEEN